MKNIPSNILGFFPTPDSFYKQVFMKKSGNTHVDNGTSFVALNRLKRTATVVVAEYQSVRVSIPIPSKTINRDGLLLDTLKALYYDALTMMLSRKYVFSSPVFRNTYSDHNDSVELAITMSVGSDIVNSRVEAFVGSIEDLLRNADDRNELAVAAVQSAYLKHSDGSFTGLEQLERLVKSTDLNRIRSVEDVFDFMCLLRGTVTGELR
jgi:hypothetical protein